MEVIKRFRGETITLATSVAFATVRGKPLWANALELEAPSSTIEAITVGFGPKIKRVYGYDASGALNSNRWSDLTDALTNRDVTSDSGSILNAWQTEDRLYIGCTRRFRGLSVDVTNANGSGSANNVGEYFNSLHTWSTLSITDGTDSSRAFDQDGLITFTVPTDWESKTLKETVGGLAELDDVPDTQKLYWLRLRPDAAFADTTVSIVELVSLLNTDVAGVTSENEGFAQVRMTSSNGGKPPYRFRLDETFGGVELVSASITTAAHLNWFQVAEEVGLHA